MKGGLRPVPAVSNLVPYVPPSGRRASDLLLDFNENTTGPSPAALRALRKLPPSALSLYPELGPWRKRFARRLGLDPAGLFLCAGTDEAIAALVGAFGRGAVAYPVPTFGMYRFYAERAGLRRREIPFGRDLAYPVEGLLRARASILFLASPNNPTGTALPREGLLRLLRKGSLVVVDEAYIEFGGESALPLLSRFPNLAVMRTFSKAYGLAGLRVGWLAGDPRIVEALERAASPYRVSTASLAAAEAALADRRATARYVAMVRAQREKLLAAIRRRGLKVYPSEANFLLIRFGRKAPAVLEGLARAGIRIRDRSSEIPGCLRVTIGTPAQMRRFLKALDQPSRPGRRPDFAGRDGRRADGAAGGRAGGDRGPRRAQRPPPGRRGRS